MKLQGAPFYLDNEDIEWVEATIKKMSMEEKIGQLFVPIGFSTEKAYLDSLLRHHIGGLFFRSGNFSEMKDTLSYAQAQSTIPLLTPANLEYGGNGAITEGTAYATPMAVAASANSQNAYTLGEISAVEAQRAGINWTFAPVVDLDLNFRNPITNVRTYGDDVETVIENAKEYTRAFHDRDMLTAIKHFPGDGVDERDQHLLTSVNSLSCQSWRRTYGNIYQELIDYGSKAVMVGHIAFPAYSDTGLPATLDQKILQELLRGELGFDGLIITDASPMVGFTAAMTRAKAVPLCIEYGCDMLLFNKSFEEDIKYMKSGVESGLLSLERLEEAVYRILATKASLGLHKEAQQEPSTIVDYSEKTRMIAEEAITLVRDDQELLPLLESGTKVLVEMLGNADSNQAVEETFVEELREAGFLVEVYQKETNFYELEDVETFKAKYDVVIYVANIENASNQTTARINWHTLFGLGNNLPWFVKEVPTMLVSFGNPYHIFDAPMIPTIINAYCNYEHFVKAAVRKITGKSSFKGQSPIDPFCTNRKLKELKKDGNQ